MRGRKIQHRVVPGGQNPHAFEQGAVREEILEGEILEQSRLVELATHARQRKYSLLLGGKSESRALQKVVKRLDAIAIARQKQALLLAIPECKGKHAVEALECPDAPGGERIQNDLGVRGGAKPIPERLKFGSQLAKVVDLAVVTEHVTMVSVDHRLLSGRREINDGQTTMPEADVALDPVSLAVRAAMRHRIGHAAQADRRNRRRVQVNHSSDATHQPSFLMESTT